jgi:hypothetical protein
MDNPIIIILSIIGYLIVGGAISGLHSAIFDYDDGDSEPVNVVVAIFWPPVLIFLIIHRAYRIILWLFS